MTKTKGVQIKNLLPASSQQKRTWRRLGGCKYPPQKSTFLIFWPSSFLYQKTRGLGATLNECIFLQKLHLLHSKEKNSEDIKTERPSSFLCQIARVSGAALTECTFSAKVHISQKKNQRRPSQDFTSRRTWIKSTTQTLKLNHKMLGGLSMGNPMGPP